MWWWLMYHHTGFQIHSVLRPDFVPWRGDIWLFVAQQKARQNFLYISWNERGFFFPISVCFFKSPNKDDIFEVSSSWSVFNSEFARCLMISFSNIMRKACKKLWIRLPNLMGIVLSRTNEKQAFFACLAVTTPIFKSSSLKTSTKNKFQARSKIFLQSDNSC